MNYISCNCQIKNFARAIFALALFFCSCSIKPVKKASSGDEDRPLPVVMASPSWFKDPLRFSSLNSDFDIETHAFFDLSPNLIKDKDVVNVFVTTPVESEFAYEVDLTSGKKFRRFRYCPQRDIWKAYGGKITYPPYSMAIVPRLLDSLGTPQRVILFGDKEFIETKKKQRVYAQSVKVIGGLIVEYCENYPCLSKNRWYSRQVLVAVNPLDPSFKKISSLVELKENVDWDYVKAFIENGDGSNISSTKRTPSYRLTGEVEGVRALNFALSRGHVFSEKNMRDMKSQCYKLFDYIWGQYKKLNLRSGRGTEEENFSKWFMNTYQKYGDHYKTCKRFVRPSNISNNTGRHWFFAFLTNFIYLESLNYTYSCKRRLWLENPRLPKGENLFSLKRERNCKIGDIEESFEHGIDLMNRLRDTFKKHFRYIEYDTGVGGSHERIYSWVPFNGKGLTCNKKYKKKRSIFPEDVSWRKVEYLIRNKTEKENKN